MLGHEGFDRKPDQHEKWRPRTTSTEFRTSARFDGMAASLAGKVALVAGATRGAGRGIAVQLGAAGATVYVTGRTTRSDRSEMDRPETIEDTAALVDEAGGRRDSGPGGPRRPPD